MKVRELIEKLNRFDQDLDVVGCTEDEKLLSDGRGFVLFEIESFDVAQVQRDRLDDNTPYLKFGSGPQSKSLVILHVTADF